MEVKLLKPYQMLSVGDTMNPPNPVAQLLIDRGIAKRVRRRKKPPQKVNNDAT